LELIVAALAKQLILRSLIVLAGCLSFCVVSLPAAAASDPQDADSAAILQQYAAAARAGDAVAALGYLLDYEVLTRGENAPPTARLTHRYGVLLMRKGKYLEATKVLKTALERSDAAFGEFAGEAFDINMNIGYAYSHLSRRRTYSTRYFDRALEVLRQRGERESILYVTALLNIVGNLVEDDGLSGDTSTSVVNNLSELQGNQRLLNLDYEYRNSFYKAKAYLDEAEELARILVDEDQYLPAKVAIARAKLDVLETIDLAKVPVGVRGRITERTVGERNDRDEEQLTAAVTVLSEDSAANAMSLAAANATLLDIAWLDNDRSRMEALCESGGLDSTGDYPSDRLFKVSADGTVIAPEFAFYVPSNLFENRIRRTEPPKDANGKPIPQPYYVPVCIDGELMAALINAPRVIIEEYP
jgi:tetratricopeptide (TPR) repeat protein